MVQGYCRAAAASLYFGGSIFGFGAMWLCLSMSPLAAQNHADSLYSAMRSTVDEHEKAKLMMELIDQRKYVSTDSPLAWSQELLQIGKRLDDPGIESDAYVQFAWLYRTLGNHASAIDFASQAIQKADQIGDQPRVAYALLEIGVIEREQANYPEAQASLIKGYSLFQQAGNLTGQGRCANALGEVARLQHRYPEARKAYSRTRELYTEAKYERGITVIQNNLGLILEAEGKYQEALDSLTMSQTAARKTDFMGLFLESTDAMARCYFKLGQLEEAEKNGLIAHDNAMLLSYKKYASSAAKTLSEVYVAKNNLPKAMDYLQRHYEIAGEIVNAATQNRMKLLSFDMELREKEAEIEVLNKNRQIRQLWSVLAIVAFVLVSVVGIVLFISVRRKHHDNKLLASQNDALADLVLEKDSLINIVAHDLKSPISKTQGLVELLATSGDFNPEQQKISGMIQKVLSDGERLIRDLLDISQVEGDRSNLSLTQFDLGALLTAQIASSREAATKKRIQLDFEPQSAQISVHSDESFVARIIDNLLSNAIKYSPAHTTVRLACGQRGDQVWFSVKDEGPGFSAEDQEKMYRKFQRLSARPTAGEGSNGLGLSIIRLLVAQLQGEVRLTSSPGKGAEFVVEIPAWLV